MYLRVSKDKSQYIIQISDIRFSSNFSIDKISYQFFRSKFYDFFYPPMKKKKKKEKKFTNRTIEKDAKWIIFQYNPN